MSEKGRAFVGGAVRLLLQGGSFWQLGNWAKQSQSRRISIDLTYVAPDEPNWCITLHEGDILLYTVSEPTLEKAIILAVAWLGGRR